MNRLFNMDNPLMRFLSRTFDMMVLNLLFIVCSIPVFTIGASLSALHYACMKMKEPDEGYVYRNFFKSFRMNFRQGTGMWLIMLVLGILLFIENRMAVQMAGNASVKPVRIMIYIAMILWYMILTWMFALQSRFVNTVGQTMKNAVLITFAKAPRSVAMVLIFIAEILIVLKAPGIVQSYAILWMLMFGFSVQVLINTQLQYPVILSLMPEEKDEPAADNRFAVDETADVSGLGYTPLPKEEESAAGTGEAEDAGTEETGSADARIGKPEETDSAKKTED